MKKYLFKASLILLFISGCSSSPVLESKESVLVLDIAKIAHAVGRDKVINEKIAKAEARLKDQLADIKNALKKQLQTEKNKLKGKSSAMISRQSQGLELKAGQELQSSVLKARQTIKQYRAELLHKFQDEIKPLAQTIAKQRQATLVRYKDPTLLWYSDSVDISDEIINKLQHAKK